MSEDKKESMSHLAFSKLKGAFLSLKQGETLERVSRPETLEEIESLGDMGPRATACLSLYQRAQDSLESLTGYQGHALKDHAYTLYRGSAQRSFKRGEKILEAIGQIGAHIPEQPKRERGESVETDWNE